MGIPSALDLSVKESTVKTVPAGETAVLACNSNDYNHNFFFWLFGNDKIIGPSNDYDESKYKYEVLSGKLHINVSILMNILLLNSLVLLCLFNIFIK